MSDGVGRYKPAIEVNALDERVGREHVERTALWLDHRGIVTRADHDPGWRGEARRDARDQRTLAKGGDGIWQRQKSAVWPNLKSPALPCGEVE